MVEVFKTNVGDPQLAMALLGQIHQRFPYLSANFDLDDCDRILRIQSGKEMIDAEIVIELLRNFGFRAEVLPDVSYWELSGISFKAEAQ